MDGAAPRGPQPPHPVAEAHQPHLGGLRRDALRVADGLHEGDVRLEVPGHLVRAEHRAGLAVEGGGGEDRVALLLPALGGALVPEQPVGRPVGLVAAELVREVRQREGVQAARHQQRALLGQHVARPRELHGVDAPPRHLRPGAHRLGRRDAVMLAAHGDDGRADAGRPVQAIGLVGQAVGPEGADGGVRQEGVLQEPGHLLRAAAAGGGEQEALPVVLAHVRTAAVGEAEVGEGALTQPPLRARHGRAGVAADEEAHERDGGGSGLLPAARKLVRDDRAEAVAPGEEAPPPLRPRVDLRLEPAQQGLEVRLQGLVRPAAAAWELHRVDLDVGHLLRDRLVGGRAGARHAEDQQGNAAVAGGREADHAAGACRLVARLAALAAGGALHLL
mmetsp:Transcript_121590/g.378442  ORF Transcript_121590/g.378442 Transcript_121590/m.378442 type:complete len:390 (-) Transcript_121590:1389-2558(-)